eukprot:scaffold296388_cov17-Prasinocladus_malaysianus.AAC.1
MYCSAPSININEGGRPILLSSDKDSAQCYILSWKPENVDLGRRSHTIISRAPICCEPLSRIARTTPG